MEREDKGKGKRRTGSLSSQVWHSGRGVGGLWWPQLGPLAQARINLTCSGHVLSPPRVPLGPAPGPGPREPAETGGPPYQRANGLVEGQAEAIAAQGQDQLFTLLQKPEGSRLLRPGPTSRRTEESDPGNSSRVCSVPQGMGPHQRKTAGRRGFPANTHGPGCQASPSREVPGEASHRLRKASAAGIGRLPQAGNIVPRDPSLPSGHRRSGQGWPASQAGNSGHSHSRTPSRAGSRCGTRYTPSLPCRGR